MAKRVGGLDHAVVEEAIQSIAAARSADEIRLLVERRGVFVDPTFHRVLAANTNGRWTAIRERIDVFFRVLAFAAHARIVEAVPPVDPATLADVPHHGSYLPPFFLMLAEQLGHALPEEQPYTLEPVRDRARLLYEVGQATGKQPVLPAFNPQPGSLWSAIVVLCGACRRQRVQMWAYCIDLVTAPDLESYLGDGKINVPACPHCGCRISFPSRIWVSEEPHAADTLYAASCIWRSRDDAWVFQPPLGTSRQTENDELMMYRARQALLPFKWPPKSGERGAGTVRTQISIAYSSADLQRLLLRSPASTLSFPRAAQGVLDSVALDLRTGRYPFYAAEDRVWEEINSDETSVSWPGADLKPFQKDEAYRQLAWSFIREAVARKRSSTAAVRAFLAAETARAYRELNQIGPAQQAMARAESVLAEAPPGSPETEFVEFSLRYERGELGAAVGDTTEANRLVEEMLPLANHGGDSLRDRLERQSILSHAALASKVRQTFGEAISRYVAAIAEWESIGQVLASDEANDATRQIKTQQSADLANLGGCYQDVARHLRLITLITAGSKSSELSQSDREFLAYGGLDPQNSIEVLRESAPVLSALFGSDVNHERLNRAAIEALERAMELSTALEVWEYVSIQSHRLALLYAGLGQHEHAEQVMLTCVGAAARHSDYDRMVSGHLYLAEQALNQGSAAKGLSHLGPAARAFLRQLVSRGHDARADSRTLFMFRFFGLRVLQKGGDPVEAALIIESLKAATTATSMITGRPDQAVANDEERGNRDALIQRREQLLLRATWQPESKGETGSQIQELEAQIARTRARASLRDNRYLQWVSAIEFDLSNAQSLRERLRRLGEETTFVGICFSAQQLWVYAIWSGGVESAVLDDVDPAMFDVSWQDMDGDALSAVANLLLTPLDKRLGVLKPDDLVVISLDETVRRVSMSALPYQGTALCERVTLCFVHGIGMLEACLDRPRLECSSVLAIGSPSRPDLDSLPGASQEVEAIDTIFASNGKGHKLLVRRDATALALEDYSAEFDVVHIACHAQSSHGQGSLALMLAPDIMKEDSGILTEERVLSRVLIRPGAHVNLAGCATGLQSDTGTTLMKGLVPVFLLAGASSVIASHWPIDDAQSVRFQQHLYTRLLEGVEPTRALAATKRACISGVLGLEMSSRNVWSAFEIFGPGGTG